MSCKEWSAFGNEFAKCLDNINDELKRLPRKEKMAFYRQARKAMKEMTAQTPAPWRAPPPPTDNKKRKAASSLPALQALWRPRK